MFHVRFLMYYIPFPIRLKPVHKVEGMTNGTASGAGQQQQQQGSGQVDISTQVQQYQQFLGEFSELRPTGMKGIYLKDLSLMAFL